jgi:hypothetical protein
LDTTSGATFETCGLPGKAYLLGDPVEVSSKIGGVPGTTEQRYWFDKTANVLAALPKSSHPGAKKALAGIWGAEDKDHAQGRREGVRGRLRPDVAQGRREITGDLDQLLVFCYYRCDHWVHLRTGQPDRIYLCDDQASQQGHQGPGSRSAGRAMTFKLIQSTQDRWRMLNGPQPGRPSPRRSDLHRRRTCPNDRARMPSPKPLKRS